MLNPILVIDRQIVFRDYITCALAEAGYSSVFAVNGREAQTLLSARTFSLVIADLSLADMSGLALIQAIRGKHPRMPLLVVSELIGPDSSELRNTLSDSGVTRTLNKPFDSARLVEVVRSMLSVHGEL